MLRHGNLLYDCLVVSVVRRDSSIATGAARRECDNPFLREVATALRSGRVAVPGSRPVYALHERVNGYGFGRVWFTTAGCRWARRGACTMCSYATAGRLDDHATVDAVRGALRRLPAIEEIFIAPSGSMLDDGEVSPRLRHLLMGAAAAHPGVRSVVTEARPVDVTPNRVTELRAAGRGARIAVGMGLESASPLVLRYCIAKLAQPMRFAAAAEVLQAASCSVHMNVTLGAPFLNTEEAIEDAVASTRWAFEHGADEVVVFPINVRRGTVVHALHRLGAYKPPSLWSLVEVLLRLPPAVLHRTQIAWYRVYNDDGGGIVEHPTSCTKCRESV